MTSVKERITKKCHSDPRVTVDALHTNHVAQLTEDELNEYYLDNGILLDTYYGDTSKIDVQIKDKPLNRINDGKVDPKGRLWFGTMDNPERNIKNGSLYCSKL